VKGTPLIMEDKEMAVGKAKTLVRWRTKK